MTELCEIMNHYGSDKGSGHHNYTLFYYELFEKMRDDTLNIFELGLGTNYTDIPSSMGTNGKPGASLRGWKHFFKNSYIYGADIDNRILFQEEKIETFYCNQKNPESINNLWNQNSIKDLFFDIIIEDGLHEFEANLIFLENSLHKLKSGGYYICEDLTNNTVLEFEKILDTLSEKFKKFTFEIKKIPNNMNSYDNNLLLIKKV